MIGGLRVGPTTTDYLLRSKSPCDLFVKVKGTRVIHPPLPSLDSPHDSSMLTRGAYTHTTFLRRMGAAPPLQTPDLSPPLTSIRGCYVLDFYHTRKRKLNVIY